MSYIHKCLNYIERFKEHLKSPSLLPFIAKTFERDVFKQLSSFLSKHNLLKTNQSGFRHGHSTETAQLSVTEALRIANADSKSSVLILLDLLLLTLSSIRSTCPPSYHWASQGFHFAGLNRISKVGLSEWPGEGRYPQNIHQSLGFLRDQLFDPSSSPHTLHHCVPSYRHMASPTIAMLMTHSSISHFDQMIQR